MATLIKTDGTKEVVLPKNNKKFEVEELESFVGGNLEIWDLSSGKSMVMIESGMLVGDAINEEATKLFHEDLESFYGNIYQS